METKKSTSITVETTVNAPVKDVWKKWTDPKHIIRWNAASADWQTTYAEADLRSGGKFMSRMEAKDGSMGFDFGGKFTAFEPEKKLAYEMGDGRKAEVVFTSEGNKTRVTETFDAESTNSEELQRSGWQAILDKFKSYAESGSNLLQMETIINAPSDVVYKTMLGEKTYREWTKPFNETSRFKGDWKKGSKMLFLGEDKEGNSGGMVSRIKENIQNKFLSIEHLGMVQGDKEITSGPEVESWAGALENYTFISENGKTRLIVDMDSNEEYKSYFEETWPKALEILKQLCEKK